MRVTNSMYYENLYGTSNSQLNSKLFDVNKQISSGLSIQYAKDDVRTFTETMRLDNELTTLGQIKKSAESGYQVSNQTDITLNEFTTSMDRTRTLLLQASNGSQSVDSRDAIATELRGLEAHFKSLANTSINGKYLFSGSATDTKPISADGTYNGNDGEIRSFLGSGVSQQHNLSGSELFLGEETNVKRKITTNLPQYSLTEKYPDFYDSTVKGVDSIITTESTIRDLMGDNDNELGAEGPSHFYISGVRSNGDAFNEHITMTGSNTVEDLLTNIGNAFGNTPNLDLVNVSLNEYGEIVIEDKISGSSKLDFHMTAAIDYNSETINNQIQTKNIDTPFNLPVNQVDTFNVGNVSGNLTGDVFTLTYDGVDYNYTTLADGESAATIGDALAAALDADANTTIVAGGDGTFTITADTAGTPLATDIALSNNLAGGGTFTDSSTNTTTTPNVLEVGEISTITIDPDAAFDVGDTYSINVDGLGAVSYKLKNGDTAEEVASGLVSAINSSPLSNNVTAVYNGQGTYTLSEVFSSPADPAAGLVIELSGANTVDIDLMYENIDTAFDIPSGTVEVNTITIDPRYSFDSGSVYTMEIDNLGKVSYVVQTGDGPAEVAAGLSTAIVGSVLLNARVGVVDNLDGTLTLTEKIVLPAVDPSGLDIKLGGESRIRYDAADVSSSMYANPGSIENLNFGETDFSRIMNGTSTAKNSSLFVREFVKSPFESAGPVITSLESIEFNLSRTVAGDDNGADDVINLSVYAEDGTETTYSQEFHIDAETTYNLLKAKIENDKNFTVDVDLASNKITLTTTPLGLANNVSVYPVEKQNIEFSDIAIGDSFTLAGITVDNTAGVSLITATELASIFENLTAGDVGNTLAGPTIGGTLTAGWGTSAAFGDSVSFTAVAPNSDLGPIAVAGTTGIFNIEEYESLTVLDGSASGAVTVTGIDTLVEKSPILNSILYDKTQFTKDGAKLLSTTPQIIKGTNAFASPSTKISEVADISNGTVDTADDTLDGTKLKLVGVDVNNVPYDVEIAFNSSGSTFSYDTNGDGIYDDKSYDIFNVGTPRVAVAADDMTYQQLMDVMNMVVSGNLPATDNLALDDAQEAIDYDLAVKSSSSTSSTYLSYDGKIQFEEIGTTDTQASIALHDVNAGNFDSALRSSVMTFNTNNALTISDPKTDFFKNLNEIITSVEEHKLYPDGTTGTSRNIGMENAIEMLDNLSKHLSRSHSSVGSNSNTLTMSIARTSLLEVSTMTLRAETIDTDIAEASLKLTQLSLNYQAMLSTVNKVSQLSLVNYLR